MQKISPEKLDEIEFYCNELGNIFFLYSRIEERYPESSGEELRDLFLFCIREFMRQGRLKFSGEGWIRCGTEPDDPMMFGETPFGSEDVVIDGLRQPVDPSPEGVAELIKSKWPPEIVPDYLAGEEGFDSIWFLKWEFEWLDEDGNPVFF